MVAAAFLNFVFRNTLQLCLVSIYIRVEVGSQTCPQLTSGSFGSRCQTLSFFEGLFFTMEGGDDLPAGWISKVSSKTGRPYYYNTKTRKSQWEVPTEPGTHL